MADTIEIIEAITSMRAAVNKSFEKVYAEIKGCNARVTEIETTLAVKKALCEKKKDDEKRKTDFWKPAIRTVTIAGFLALIAMAWARIKAVLDLVG